MGITILSPVSLLPCAIGHKLGLDSIQRVEDVKLVIRHVATTMQRHAPDVMAAERQAEFTPA